MRARIDGDETTGGCLRRMCWWCVGKCRSSPVHEGYVRGTGRTNRWCWACRGTTVKDGLFATFEPVIELSGTGSD